MGSGVRLACKKLLWSILSKAPENTPLQGKTKTVSVGWVAQQPYVNCISKY